MKLLIVLLSYLWIGLLHSSLVGTFIFAWFGGTISSTNKWKCAILIFGILFFFESYWIPIFNMLQLKIYISETSILDYFKITEQINLVNTLTPSIVTVVSCALQTMLALYIGQKFKNKMMMYAK